MNVIKEVCFLYVQNMEICNVMESSLVLCLKINIKLK